MSIRSAFFNFPLSPESSKYENDEGGGQLKQTRIYVSLDILVSVVRMARVV